MDPVTLNGPGFILRPWTPDDAPAAHRLIGDPEIPRFMGIPHDQTAEKTGAFIASRTQAWLDGTSYTFAIIDSESGALLGSIAIDPSLDDPAIGEIGYWMGAHSRNRGIATQAVGVVAGWGFDACGFDRLEITTHVDNLASQRVAEKAGFTREGVLRRWREHHGTRVDLVMFSRLAGE